MISEHSDFKSYQSYQGAEFSQTDEQRLKSIDEINEAIKREIKKVKNPYLLKTDDWFVPTVRLYSAKIPRKLYWTEISKVKSLRMLFARIATSTVVATGSGINVMRIAIIVSVVLAILLLLGLGTLFILNTLQEGEGQIGPQIEVDKAGEINIKVFTDADDWHPDCIVRVSNYNLDTIIYTPINERVLIKNISSTNEPLYILMYAEIVPDDSNAYSNVGELYIALDEVDSAFSFEKSNKGVLYTPAPIDYEQSFYAFQGLGICLYSNVEANLWGNQIVHIKIHFRGYTDLDSLRHDMSTLTSAIYSVDKKDVDGEVISSINPALKSKLQ